MKIEILANPGSVARKGASMIAELARIAVAERGRFIFGVSGGRTPWMMLRDLAREDIPWNSVDLVQVDERVAPENHPDRNLTALIESLRDSPLRRDRIHAMPVESPDPLAAAARYSALLKSIAGEPVVLDLVHLGLGDDGHTASLVPGDPVLDVADADVAITREYRGRRRMTLTFPLLNRSRQVLWVVTGTEKVDALRRLREGDATIPAGRVRIDSAVILADRAAAGQ